MGVPRAVVMDFRGEVVVIKDLIFRLYKQGFSSEDVALTASCLRAISWASLALCRLVQTHDHFMPLNDTNPYVVGMQMDVLEKFKQVSDRLLGRKTPPIPRSLAGIPELEDEFEEEEPEFVEKAEPEPEVKPAPVKKPEPDPVPKDPKTGFPLPVFPLPGPIETPIPGCHPAYYFEPHYFSCDSDWCNPDHPKPLLDYFGLLDNIDFDPVSEF